MSGDLSHIFEWMQKSAGINTNGLILLPAKALVGKHYPPFSPAFPVLITCGEAVELLRVAEVLQAVYPAEHTVYTAQLPVTEETGVSQSTLHQLPGFMPTPAIVYLPALDKGDSFEDFADVVARLRAPDGCPWDRKQTHLSLRPYLLEETYEALAALDLENPAGLAEELGDLLLQILLHAQIGAELETFNMRQVIRHVHDKIVRRHPHVFSGWVVNGVSEVLQNWEALKAEERQEKGEAEEKGLLDSVPPALPALSQAQQVQDRAARVGFDWHEITPVWDKVYEELEEIRQAPDEESRAGELGDLLFAVVNLVRWHGVDAESALRESDARFRRRFKYIETKARQQGRRLAEMTLEEMDIWWEEAKKL
jgi:tetrapyrrole methylase family protein/MazG family protein